MLQETVTWNLSDLWLKSGRTVQKQREQGFFLFLQKELEIGTLHRVQVKEHFHCC